MHSPLRLYRWLTYHRLNPEDPANLKATQLMCDLHDALGAGGAGLFAFSTGPAPKVEWSVLTLW